MVEVLAQQGTDFGPTLEALTAFLAVTLPLAVGVTKLVDFIRNLFDRGNNAPAWLWNVVAMAVGILICAGWGINLLGALVATVPALAETDLGEGFGGTILTGIMVGGMAGFWHDKMAEWAAAHKRVVA